MTTKARYQRALALTQEENLLLEALQGQKIRVIDIFRKGLEIYAPKVPKEVLRKVKDLVK